MTGKKRPRATAGASAAAAAPRRPRPRAGLPKALLGAALLLAAAAAFVVRCPAHRGRGASARQAAADDGAPSSSLEDELARHATSASLLLGRVRSVGIDYGEVRTGLATSLGYDFLPLSIISGLDPAGLCARVVAAVRSEGASRAVVGLPLHKNGTESVRSGLTRDFARNLSEACLAELGPTGFEGVYMWDERYTSKEAKAQILSSSAGPRVRERDLEGTIDADAACLILEHYYRSDGVGAELMAVEDGERREDCLRRWEVRRAEMEREKEETSRRRDEALHARKAMIDRIRAMEEESGTGDAAGRKRKKKKKKKK